jgi:hypothetical protein
MAITGVTINQNNFVGSSDLLPVHSTLVFLVDVNYSGAVPDVLLVDISDDSGVLATYRAIPYKDPLSTQRQFAFVANDVIKGLMGEFDDELQLNETLVYVEDITKTLDLKFYDPDNETTNDQVTATFIHGAAQFGENPNFDAIYNNETDTYLVPSGSFAYVYSYNESEGNTLTIGDANLQEVVAEDFNDDDFTDFNDEVFTIDVPL